MKESTLKKSGKGNDGKRKKEEKSIVGKLEWKRNVKNERKNQSKKTGSNGFNERKYITCIEKVEWKGIGKNEIKKKGRTEERKKESIENILKS